MGGGGRPAVGAAKPADDHTLANHLADALTVRRRHYMLHPACAFQPTASYFDACAAMTGTSPAEARMAAYQLIDMGENPLSRRIELLYELALTARQDAEVAALIADPPPGVLARLAGIPHGCIFLEHLERFLDDYGELTGNGWGSEVLLRHPTWRERPETVLAFLGPYLDAEVESPAATRGHVQQALEGRVEAKVEAGEPDDTGLLVGQGASAGCCRGRARVIVDMQSLPKLEHGDILIARNVGPAWLPLFPLLGGLILEGGSIGQHAAATAREYGIPAVVNVKHAIERIPDWSWVTVDGASGTVELSDGL
jgi:phosphohistidine swiveling domain-containing protein